MKEIDMIIYFFKLFEKILKKAFYWGKEKDIYKRRKKILFMVNWKKYLNELVSDFEKVPLISIIDDF